jgi:ABC-type sugar transport system ATPase subunit
VSAALPAPILRLRDIKKSFGPIEVLRGVDLDVHAGEVLVLAGENGAGKSTLIKILSGVYQDYTGVLQLDGMARRFRNATDAVRAGISTIHQELALVPTMSVTDNLFLGREVSDRFGRIDFKRERRDAAGILQRSGIEAAPEDEVGQLSVSVQQSIAIARALARDLRILVLDEPTSALDERDVASLFERLRSLRQSGCAIIYITHKMEEIYQLADRITVLRDGRVVGTETASGLPQATLVSWMVGRAVSEPDSGSQTHDVDAPVLEVADLYVPHPTRSGRNTVSDVSLTVGQGEIVGLAGLQGCGASDVLHAVFGAIARRDGARFRLSGRPFEPTSPADSIARGLVLLTNDRAAKGVIPDLSVTHNATLSALPRFASSWGWIDQSAERLAVRDLGKRFALKTESYDAPLRTLSGGNQQKVYLARCLLPKPRLLLLDEPTRGIDIAAKADIYRLLRGWAAEGIGILLITSELSELLTLADRILVMHRGTMNAEFSRAVATKDLILAAAMGTPADAETTT